MESMTIVLIRVNHLTAIGEKTTTHQIKFPHIKFEDENRLRKKLTKLIAKLYHVKKRAVSVVFISRFNR